MRTIDGIKRAFDEGYEACKAQDADDPREDKRSREQIYPELYAAALVLAQAKEALTVIMDEARSSGMSEDIRGMVIYNAEREAEI